MKRFLSILLLALFAASPSYAEVWQARYGVAETFNFRLYNADGTLDVDEADGGTEVSLSCNEGAETTATNDFVDEGTFYSIALTSGEMQCERIAVVIAATTTEVFFIQTFEHTSAMNPTLGWLTGDAFARLGAPAGASVSADVAAMKVDTAAILVDTGTTLDDLVDDLESRLGTPSNLGGGATVAGNLSDIEGQTDDIGTAGAGLTNIDLPNQTMDISGTITTATNVTTVNGLASGAITAAAIATDAIGAAEVAAGALTEDAFDTTAGSFKPFGILDQGTAQSATSTTVVLRSAAAFGDDTVLGATIMVCGSTQGYCQAGLITDYVGSTDTATVATWGVTPSGTITYYMFGSAPSSGGGGLDAAGVRAAIGMASANLDTQLTAIDDYVDTEVAAILVDTGTTLDGRIPAALVGGRMDVNLGAISSDATAADNAEAFFDGTGYAGTGNVIPTVTTATNLTNLPAITAGWLTATGIASDAITDAKVASDVTIASVTGAVGSVTGAVGSVTGNVGGNVTGTIGGLTAGALADLFDTNSGTTYASAVAGSVVKEMADNAGGSALTTDAIAEAMFTYNATATYGTADAGSVVKQIADNAGGSALTVEAIRTEMDSNSTQLAKLGTPAGASISADIAAIEAQTDDIGAAGAGLTALATQVSVNDLPTNAELATSQAAADDATLAAIAALNNLSSAQAETAAAAALTAYDPPSKAELDAGFSALLASQQIIVGTCDSGSTTTCVDDALTQAGASQLEDRLICFDDSFCALITTFTPASDTATTTKVAPSTRASKVYTIFPATLE